MLRTFAVALLAASVFTAPVFAQGNGAAAMPPAKAEVKGDKAAPKLVTAKPTLKNAKVNTSKRYARHHVKHVKHVAHVKGVKPVKTAHAVDATKGHKHVQHVASKTTGNGANGTTAKAKANVN